MTSSASPATWLPAAIMRAAVVTAPPAQWVPPGRHRAPELAATMESVATGQDLQRRGRHAEPEWHRELFDAVRDEDPLDWLGFANRD